MEESANHLNKGMGEFKETIELIDLLYSRRPKFDIRISECKEDSKGKYFEDFEIVNIGDIGAEIQSVYFSFAEATIDTIESRNVGVDPINDINGMLVYSTAGRKNSEMLPQRPYRFFQKIRLKKGVSSLAVQIELSYTSRNIDDLYKAVRIFKCK